MAKTLKDFLEGYLKVKSADEQKFIDKHVTAKNPDRNGNGDDVFKGNTKPIDRRKERKGYNPGEDEKVYEELKGNQHKIDANKNGKVDAHDFKLLRKKKVNEASYKDGDYLETDLKKRKKNNDKAIKDMKKMGSPMRNPAFGEEAEQIDELDQKLGGTLSRYINKTKDNPKREAGRNLALKKRWGDAKYGTPEPKVKAAVREEAEQIDELSTDTLRKYREKARDDAFDAHDVDDDRRLRKRSFGANQAGKKILKRGEPLRKEEVEPIEELSKATLRSYAQNAKDQMSRSDTLAGREMGARAAGAKPSAKERMHNRRADKRHAGLGLAIDKLAREEVEHIEEAGYSAKAARAGKDIGKPGKQFAKIASAAAKKYGSAERGQKVAGAVLAKLRKEEKLADLISDLSESHQRTMMTVFEKLNEDNKSKFLEACDTPDGVEQMLDFAINHRGE